MEAIEFTSLCPITGQPDYGRVVIKYAPSKKCLESKSLKLYLGSYRQYGGFAEQITRRICNDVLAVIDPIWIEVRSKFTFRGGISIEAVAQGKDPKNGTVLI